MKTTLNATIISIKRYHDGKNYLTYQITGETEERSMLIDVKENPVDGLKKEIQKINRVKKENERFIGKEITIEL
ncbi:MAG: hypothetical protein Q7T34_01000 [Candidatus Parcubacteria bacterium]|nr:hypothetical protein [Candidatus Parcubacteria bacterium]